MRRMEDWFLFFMLLQGLDPSFEKASLIVEQYVFISSIEVSIKDGRDSLFG